MPKYLAVDFGTTNCLAAWVDDEKKSSLIPLDGTSPIFPSAIFSKYNDPIPKVISDIDFRRGLKEAMDQERLRLNNQETDIKSQLNLFRRQKGPRRKAPVQSEFRNYYTFQQALEDYNLGLPTLPARIARFETKDVPAKERELRQMQIPAVGDAEIKQQVRFLLERKLLEARAKVYENLNFFNSMHDDRFTTLYGREAIDAYVQDPLGGFFMRSPKAFLGSKLDPSRTAVFSDIVGKFLREIRRRAQAHTNIEFDGLVIGRPLHFVGSSYGGSDEQAVSILKNAARSAGFSQVRFVMEPFAAALAIGNAIFDVNYPAMVVDVGGGTTDIAYFGVQRDALVKLQVESTAGERVGGSDFDQSLAFVHIGRILGNGSNYTSGAPIPSRYYDLAFSTRDLEKQLEFRRVGKEIEQMIPKATDNVGLGRLQEVYRDQLQHFLLLNAEQAKISLSSKDTIEMKLGCFSVPVEIVLKKEDVSTTCAQSTRKIQDLICSAIKNSNMPDSPVRVFLTGGMSYNEDVIGAVKTAIPKRSTLARIPAFQSIVAGLALVSYQLSVATSLATEPSNYRGIPIEQ
jgi:hypothetical chaperone protein